MRLLSTVHPHPRGESRPKTYDGQSGDGVGSPPPAWGKLTQPSASVIINMAGFTPTRVGKAVDLDTADANLHGGFTPTRVGKASQESDAT